MFDEPTLQPVDRIRLVIYRIVEEVTLKKLTTQNLLLYLSVDIGIYSTIATCPGFVRVDDGKYNIAYVSMGWAAYFFRRSQQISLCLSLYAQKLNKLFTKTVHENHSIYK